MSSAAVLLPAEAAAYSASVARREARGSLRASRGRAELVSVEGIADGSETVDVALHAREARLVVHEEERVFRSLDVVSDLAKASELK
jgi:hypothetical protein